jgi:hypothetical protein
MKTFSGATTAALAGPVAIVQLVHLAFATPIALNLSTWDLVWDGVTYKGAAGMGTISAVQDKPGEVQGIVLELSAGDSARISLALDESDLVKGTVCTIRTAIIETENYTILDAPIDWIGKLDTMSIGEDGVTANIRVTAESRAVDLLRGNVSFYSDADQTKINPTDRSFKFVVDQIDRPIVWPAKTFFYR